MMILKRNGKKEEFTIEKIKTSILNASNEAGISLNHSDLKLILKSIELQINSLHKRQDTANVYEVRSLIQFELNNMGFKKIADMYSCFLKDF